MIRLIFNLLILNVFIFATEVTVIPDMSVSYEITDIKDYDMKIKINCKHEKTIFGNKKYSEQQIIDELLNEICVNENNVSSFNSLKEQVKKISLKNNYKVVFNIKSSYKELIEREKELYLNLKFVKNNFFGSSDGEIDFIIIDLKNINLNINSLYKINENEFIKKDTNILSLYKFDYVKNKIEAYELEKPLKKSNLKTFTNTYNVDVITECINGSIWVKKYGAKSGEYCNWIEK